MKKGLIILAVGILLTACTTTEVVTVEKVRTDTTYINKVVRDSVWLHDSTFVKVAGDTVMIERWHTKFKLLERHDTIFQHCVDSVPVPYPVEKLVEKKLSTPQKVLMCVGAMALMALAVILIGRLKNLLP